MKNLRYMIAFPVLLIIVSVVGGWRCYDRAKTDMVRDLNQALERVVASSATVDGVLETLPTLQGSPMLTFGGGQTDLARQLQIPTLRDTACISYCLSNVREQSSDASALQTARICSDTIMLARHTAEGVETVVTVKAYANPTLASIISYGGSAWPLTSFIAGVLMLGMMLMAHRTATKAQCAGETVIQQQHSPALTASATKCGNLNLTPMQEQLMQLFYASPSRTLSREEICSALWPKKDSPEDGLYTFISRMKSSLAGQSSLRIVNRRGREYVLVDEMDEKHC